MSSFLRLKMGHEKGGKGRRQGDRREESGGACDLGGSGLYWSLCVREARQSGCRTGLLLGVRQMTWSRNDQSGSGIGHAMRRQFGNLMSNDLAP